MEDCHERYLRHLAIQFKIKYGAFDTINLHKTGFVITISRN